MIDLSDRVDLAQERLAGLTKADVLSPPVLPAGPTQPKKGMIAVVALLATGFALLMWVFVRQAFAGAAQNPESAAKLARIRMALGFKS
jgi:uncharacterized protein involved in exopolysaccharide biosynthesis